MKTDSLNATQAGTAEQKLASTQVAVKSGVALVQGLCEAVREAKRIPRGTLFAAFENAVQGKLQPGDTAFGLYEAIEPLMIRTGLVKRKGHELLWVGPR